jgi:hypothetical protein
MTWSEICEDKLLATLPYRIESDRWGNIVMSPPPRSRRAEYQTEIDRDVTFFGPAGLIPESRLCPGFPKRVLLEG